MATTSTRHAITILGAAAFALAGCREEQVDAQAFPDLQSCTEAATRGGMFSVEDCRASFAEAEALHVEAAPRYDSVAVCEEQHGEGACGTEAAANPHHLAVLRRPVIFSVLAHAGHEDHVADALADMEEVSVRC